MPEDFLRKGGGGKLHIYSYGEKLVKYEVKKKKERKEKMQ